MLDGDLLLPVGLLHVGLQEVLVVLDGVVPGGEAHTPALGSQSSQKVLL